jgi:hypothetical protein
MGLKLDRGRPASRSRIDERMRKSKASVMSLGHFGNDCATGARNGLLKPGAVG